MAVQDDNDDCAAFLNQLQSLIVRKKLSLRLIISYCKERVKRGRVNLPPLKLVTTCDEESSPVRSRIPMRIPKDKCPSPTLAPLPACLPSSNNSKRIVTSKIPIPSRPISRSPTPSLQPSSKLARTMSQLTPVVKGLDKIIKEMENLAVEKNLQYDSPKGILKLFYLL